MKKYYKKKYKRVFLKNRDLNVIEYGLDQKFLTMSQVARVFLGGKFEFEENGIRKKYKDPKHRTYQRMRILRKLGYLSILEGSEAILVPSRQGMEALNLHGRSTFNDFKTPDFKTFEHDRRVTDVRLVLEDMGVLGRWVSERWLRMDVGEENVPDGLVETRDGKLVAVEVEIARKTKQRYVRIFEAYKSRGLKVDRVLYVCDSLDLMEVISSLLDGYQDAYFCLYRDLMERNGDLLVASLQGTCELRAIL